METGTKNLITCFVMAATGTIILLCLFGCGKRITTSERHSINKDSISINKSFELTQNTTFSDIGTLRPFDPLKPMIVGGNYYYNTVIGFDKSIKKGVEIKSKQNLSYKGSEESGSKKSTESNNRNLLWIGLSLVIGTLFVLYLTLTKYKIL